MRAISLEACRKMERERYLWGADIWHSGLDAAWVAY